jgi:hypothetical protein
LTNFYEGYKILYIIFGGKRMANEANEYDDVLEWLRGETDFYRCKDKKELDIEKAVLNIIMHHKEIGMQPDKKGHLKNVEDNLIEKFDNWIEIQDELLKGQGSELKEKNGEIKFLSVRSSCALCVNTFSLLKKLKEKIGFNEASFEKKLFTGISTPNLDFCLENNDIIIGIESKFTEIFTEKYPNDKNNLEKYINRDELNYLPVGFEEVIKYYISLDRKLHLDVAQLIKHCIGLLKNKNNRRARLLYVYWTPLNYNEFELYNKHFDEIIEFNFKINKYIDFRWSSYEDFWKNYEEDDLFRNHIQKLRERYNFNIDI